MSIKLRVPSLPQAALIGLLAFGAAGCAIDDHARGAANAQAGNSSDLLGNGGPQDALAREIYHPGRGTDW